ncbi:MAG: hypothetical protein Kow00128_01900 [Deltaproteobacteria bacterium]
MAHFLIRSILLFLFLFPATAVSAGGFHGECDIRFHGRSTLHDFEGKAPCLPFGAETTTDASGKASLPVVVVEIPVAGMDTGNGSRDEQMRKMFDADRFPRIRGIARDVDIEAVRKAARGGTAELDLLLRIREVERPVRAAVTGLREEGNTVRFDLSFPVSRKEFGLKAPSVLFFIRVKDKVLVRGNFRLDRSSNEQRPDE